MKSIEELKTKVDVSALMESPVSNWRPILAKECQVYVFNEGYIAKRFDQINYKFCSKDEAKEILIDNLYALLRYKYFKAISEDIDKKIESIVKNFTANLKTTLIKISYDDYSDCEKIKMLPDYCIAFRNGVFNFKDNEWFFKYDVIQIIGLSNKMYIYNPEYTVLWYMNYDFEPLGFDLNEISLRDFVDILKDLTKTSRNYAFELMYNIAHDANDKFDFKRFQHLCEILGYSVLQSFSQYFIMLIGSGQNGKNSLFDGCFSNRVVPSPANNDMDALENDRFITGSLENKAQNIFLETSAKTYTESKMIKALTGSMYQTIENKGVNKYSSIINCKYIFAGNDQEKIKFSDTTVGFKRRINMFEIFYKWDSKKKFMLKGDYYDTSFSDSLYELKSDSLNTTVYLYLAMYGIKIATVNFTSNFKFSSNDWKDTYSDIDSDLKEKVSTITLNSLLAFMKSNQRNYKLCEELFYDMDKVKLYKSKNLRKWGYVNYSDMIEMLSDDELRSAFFAENDIYISVRILQEYCRVLESSALFTQNLKKAFNITKFETMGANKPYLKVTFINGVIKIINN